MAEMEWRSPPPPWLNQERLSRLFIVGSCNGCGAPLLWSGACEYCGAGRMPEPRGILGDTPAACDWTRLR